MRQKMGHNAVYPDFGRRLTQNCWQKVNCFGAPSKIMMIMINIIIYKKKQLHSERAVSLGCYQRNRWKDDTACSDTFKQPRHCS